jgi:hypothetical protein
VDVKCHYHYQVGPFGALNAEKWLGKMLEGPSSLRVWSPSSLFSPTGVRIEKFSSRDYDIFVTRHYLNGTTRC